MMHKHILKLAILYKKYPICPESMKNVRSYFSFERKIRCLLKLTDVCIVKSQIF